MLINPKHTKGYRSSEHGILVPEHLARGRGSNELKDLAEMASRLNSRMGNGYTNLLIAQEGAGANFASFTTAKRVINDQAAYNVNGDFFKIRKRLRVELQCAISNIVTTPGLFNIQLKIGSAVAYDTGNIQLNATAHTTLPFWLTLLLTCRAVGATTTANIMGLGQATGFMITKTAGQVDDAQGMQTLLVPQTAPVVGAGFDSTITNLIDLFAGFTISNAANLIRVDQYAIYEEN